MRFFRWMLLAVAAVFMFAASGYCGDAYWIYDVASGRRQALEAAAPSLAKYGFIVVGEHHTDPESHAAQLAVIRALDSAGARVSVGMEMFRRDHQPVLDQWVAGKMEEARFERAYAANWNYPWPLYREIFIHARDRGLAMAGLNVPPEITRQVAREGFDSLSDAQRGKLPPIACRVDRAYMEFIRRAFGAHAHGNLDFGRFCEAQLVWDTVMAINAVEFMKGRDGVMVVLAGAGHAWKLGIPAQLEPRTGAGIASVLPFVKGGIEPGAVTPEEADYIIGKD